MQVAPSTLKDIAEAVDWMEAFEAGRRAALPNNEPAVAPEARRRRRFLQRANSPSAATFFVEVEKFRQFTDEVEAQGACVHAARGFSTWFEQCADDAALPVKLGAHELAAAESKIERHRAAQTRRRRATQAQTLSSTHGRGRGGGRGRGRSSGGGAGRGARGRARGRSTVGGERRQAQRDAGASAGSAGSLSACDEGSGVVVLSGILSSLLRGATYSEKRVAEDRRRTSLFVSTAEERREKERRSEPATCAEYLGPQLFGAELYEMS